MYLSSHIKLTLQVVQLANKYISPSTKKDNENEMHAYTLFSNTMRTVAGREIKKDIFTTRSSPHQVIQDFDSSYICYSITHEVLVHDAINPDGTSHGRRNRCTRFTYSLMKAFAPTKINDLI